MLRLYPLGKKHKSDTAPSASGTEMAKKRFVMLRQRWTKHKPGGGVLGESRKFFTADIGAGSNSWCAWVDSM